MAASFNRHEYVVGVMTMEVEGKDSERFHHQVTQAVEAFKQALTSALGVRVALLTFLLQIGMTEELERDVHFLLIATEVDLMAMTLSYTLTLPASSPMLGWSEPNVSSQSFGAIGRMRCLPSGACRSCCSTFLADPPLG